MKKRFNMILAMTAEGGIALEGSIPWKIDYFFLKKTLGKTLLCGSTTYKTLPVLKSRKIICAERIVPFETYLGKFKYLIGGKILYDIGAENPACNKIYITICAPHTCDLFMPHMRDLYLNSMVKIGANIFKLYKTKPLKHDELNRTVYIYKNISVDFDYLRLCKYILNSPELEKIGTSISYNIIENHIPIITTKKIFIRGVIEELLFFLRGETNTKILESKGINIWRGNTTRQFLDSRNLDYPEGEAGPIYGAQWRKQIPYVINELRTNPHSRRAIFSAWIPEDIPKMCLPPCHILYQFLIREDTLNLVMFQRSADVFLGLPFNLASCGFLLIIFADILGYKTGTITIHIGSAHIYKEHIEAVRQQIENAPHNIATVKYIGKPYIDITYFDDIKYEDFDIQYKSAEKIQAPLICN